MFSIVKAVFAAVIVLGSVSLGAAQALAANHRHSADARRSLQSRDASLNSLAVPSPAQEEWFDRATQSFGGGK
jgi:hypothetical protein